MENCDKGQLDIKVCRARLLLCGLLTGSQAMMLPHKIWKKKRKNIFQSPVTATPDHESNDQFRLQVRNPAADSYRGGASCALRGDRGCERVQEEGCNSPGLLLQSSHPQAIYQLHKTKVSALIWPFYCGIKVTPPPTSPPQKSSWRSWLCKDKGHYPRLRDLMTLVNKKWLLIYQ